VWVGDRLEITETTTSRIGCRHGEAAISFAAFEDDSASLPQWTRAADGVNGQSPTWRRRYAGSSDPADTVRRQIFSRVVL
jgi:hypothetical protein